MIIFVLSFVSTQIALYILIFSMLLSPEIIVGETEGASLGRGITLRVDDFLVAVIGFSWLARMAINKELGLFLKTPLNRPIAYYVLVCIASTLLGALFGRLDLKTGLLFVLKYFEYVVIYFMVANHFKDRKQLKTFVWAMLLTGLIVSVLSIVQIPEGGRISAPFEGKVGEPNTFGGYLVFMMSLAAGLALMEESLRKRLTAFALVILFSIPLLYTQSRSSYLAAIPAVLSFLWLSKRKQWIPPVLLLVGLLLPFMAPKVTKDRSVVHLYPGHWPSGCGHHCGCAAGHIDFRENPELGRSHQRAWPSILCSDSESPDTALWMPSMSGSPRRQVSWVCSRFSPFARYNT